MLVRRYQFGLLSFALERIYSLTHLRAKIPVLCTSVAFTCPLNVRRCVTLNFSDLEVFQAPLKQQFVVIKATNCTSTRIDFCAS